MLTDNQILLAALDEYVEGHLEAKKALIVMLQRSKLRSYQKYTKNMGDDFLIAPMKLLLLGSSGTGKTHLISSLQKISCFPLIKIDATHLNPVGATGGLKPEGLQELIRKNAQATCLSHPILFPYLEPAIEQTVVFCDELDKLGRNFEGSSNWNRHVQSTFLTMFDNKDEFSGVSFVFAGAFDDVVNKVEDKVVGFTRTLADTENLDDAIVNTGIIPELVGRINSIIKLDNFSKETYMHILETRLLPKKSIDLAAMGVFDIMLTDEQKSAIVTKTHESRQGVRFLQRELDKLLLDREFELTLELTEQL